MQILEARLQTAALEEQRDFYSRTLGLALEADTGDAFAVRAGSTLLRFERVSAGKPTYHFAFNVPANRFAEAKAWIAGLVDLVTVDGADEFDFSSWNAHAVYFFDPAGNIVELISRHGLPNAAEAPELLELSEIGMPTPDVPALVERIGSELGLALFDDGGASFAALGDELGLLIVVPEGRVWFPRAGQNGIWPLELTISAPLQADMQPAGLPYRVRSQPAD